MAFVLVCNRPNGFSFYHGSVSTIICSETTDYRETSPLTIIFTDVLVNTANLNVSRAVLKYRWV